VRRTGTSGIRKALLAILAFGLIGTGSELLLLEHHETATQLIPLILLGLGLAAAIWNLSSGRAASTVFMRVTMVGFIAAGILGTLLHYRGSVQFQKEIDPSISGLALFSKAIHAKAPPALAPGAMIWLGLLGLACTWFADKEGEGRDHE
jgi:hypothetical protein